LAALLGVLDPSYANDSPQPFVLRSLSSGGRQAGALQSPR
jgi:hypothetical protein